MHARCERLRALGTLSDDPSLGEAVIDAFWPDWPTDCFMMVIIHKFPKCWQADILNILYWLHYFHNLILASLGTCAFLVSESVEEVNVLVVRMEMAALIKVTNIDQWVRGEMKQSATSGSQLLLNTYSGWKLKVTLLRKPS